MNKFTYYILIVFILLSCASGSGQNDNAEMYLSGIEALEANDDNTAIKLFSQTSEIEGTASASLATEKLLPLLYDKGDFKEIIKITNEKLFSENKEEENLSYYKIDNDYLYRYLLLSMISIDDKNIEEIIFPWVLNNSFSKEHYSFFLDDVFITYNEKNPFSSQLQDLILIKRLVYERNYGVAVSTIVNSANYDKENPEKYFENLNALTLSALGRAFLYGGSNKTTYAQSFENSAKTYPEKSTEAFMCYFYAGRLYNFAGTIYSSESLLALENAMNSAIEDIDYDTALWYYLSVTKENSSRSTITALQEYANTWKDPYYFDDILESLAYQLLDNENYKGFYSLYEFLIPYVSPESLSKYAYISYLLIEGDYVSVEGQDKEDAKKDALQKAYNADGGSLYYRMMASVELDVSSDKVLRDLLKRDNNDSVFDSEFEYILNELLVRGLVDETYSLYVDNSNLVSVENAIMLSNQISLVNNPSLENNYNDNYFPESLRLASQAFNQSEKDISKEDMKLLYPTYYTEFVKQVSQEYNLEEFIIYAIMRSESFFDHDVSSWAGAVGLTQLMPTTAGDIARKLRVRDYDLHDARQNIDFGMFYFDELIPREGVDNSILRALFAYNAGITNVRRWKRAFPELLDTPELFLEKIPFAETREYGRKVLSAAVMYGLLYYDMEVSDVVQAIMN